MLPRDEVTVAAGGCPRCEYNEYRALFYRMIASAQAELVVDLQRRLRAGTTSRTYKDTVDGTPQGI